MGTLVFEVLRSNFNHTQRTCRIDKKEREKKKSQSYHQPRRSFCSSSFECMNVGKLSAIFKKKKKKIIEEYIRNS